MSCCLAEQRISIYEGSTQMSTVKDPSDDRNDSMRSWGPHGRTARPGSRRAAPTCGLPGNTRSIPTSTSSGMHRPIPTCSTFHRRWCRSTRRRYGIALIIASAWKLSKHEFCSVTSLGIHRRTESDGLADPARFRHQLPKQSLGLRPDRSRRRVPTLKDVRAHDRHLRPRYRPPWRTLFAKRERLAGLIAEPIAVFAGAPVDRGIHRRATARDLPRRDPAAPRPAPSPESTSSKKPRHIKYAREELKRQLAQRSPLRRHAVAYLVAQCARLHSNDSH